MRRSVLHYSDILRWADAFHRRAGRWPNESDGRIDEARDEKWVNINSALRLGLRGFPGDDTLARVFARYRSVRNRKGLPKFTVTQILTWADAFYARHGRWPVSRSGPISKAPGETWLAVDMALRNGLRGLPAGSSLALLLAQKRGLRHRDLLRPLSRELILSWADAHGERTGLWPHTESGPISQAPGETWLIVDKALRAGKRGLPGRVSLSRLLASERGVRPRHRRRPPLDIERILVWADQHYKRTAKWPNCLSGAVRDVPGESWNPVHEALRDGLRGLPGGSSLRELLADRRGVRNKQFPPRLSIHQISRWAHAHLAKTGTLPTRDSGPIAGAPGETWCAVNVALAQGHRGLPGGSSLAQVLRPNRTRRQRRVRQKSSARLRSSSRE